MFLNPTGLGPLGLQPEQLDCIGISRVSGNLQPGQLVMLDSAQAATGTSNSRPGNPNGSFSNFILPNEATGTVNGAQRLLYGTFAVYLGNAKGDAVSITAGEQGMFRIVGQVKAAMTNNAGANAAGVGSPVWAPSVTAVADANLNTNGDHTLGGAPALVANPCKVLGWLDESSPATDNSSSSIVLRRTTFNGLGCGWMNTTI